MPRTIKQLGGHWWVCTTTMCVDVPIILGSACVTPVAWYLLHLVSCAEKYHTITPTTVLLQSPLVYPSPCHSLPRSLLPADVMSQCSTENNPQTLVCVHGFWNWVWSTKSVSFMNPALQEFPVMFGQLACGWGNMSKHCNSSNPQSSCKESCIDALVSLHTLRFVNDSWVHTYIA